MLYSYLDFDLIPFVYAKVLNSISFQCSRTPAVPVSQFQAVPDCVGFFFFLTKRTQVNHVVKKKNHWGQAFFYPLETKSVIKHPSTKGSFH